MYMTNFWPVDPADIVEHLQAEQDIELAYLEQQRNWQAMLATMDRKARYREKNKALLRHKEGMRRAA